MMNSKLRLPKSQANPAHVLALALLLLPAFAHMGFSENVPNYRPITGKQRLRWFVKSTIGPRSLFLAGPSSAAWGTALNDPGEYGPHWEGFGKATPCG